MKFKYFSVLVSVFFVFNLTACQTAEDEIGKKAAESLIGDALGGKVQIDNEGNMQIQTEDGTAVIGGGASRPTSAPEDLPSLPGASDFSWMGSEEGGWFVYKVAGSDLKTVCDEQVKLLLSAGWEVKEESISFESADTITNNYFKQGFTATLSCTRESDGVSMLMTKSKM